MNLNKELQKIYPLTIVSMRYKNLFIIFNSISVSGYITDAAEDEEISYVIYDWLEKHCPVNYGIGETLEEALIDYNGRLIIK